MARLDRAIPCQRGTVTVAPAPPLRDGPVKPGHDGLAMTVFSHSLAGPPSTSSVSRSSLQSRPGVGDA